MASDMILGMITFRDKSGNSLRSELDFMRFFLFAFFPRFNFEQIGKNVNAVDYSHNAVCVTWHAGQQCPRIEVHGKDVRPNSVREIRNE